MGKYLGDELLELFNLPDDISTIITENGHGSTVRALASEKLARLGDREKIQIALAKMGFAVDRLAENMEGQVRRLLAQEERCRAIQAGETPYGCAHLENLKSTFWRFVAVSFSLPIVVAIIIATIVSLVRG